MNEPINEHLAIQPSGKIDLDQTELDQLLALNGLLSDEKGPGNRSLVEELEDAVLDSGKLSLAEWVALRERLRAIERLIPHIDLIIQLKGHLRRRSNGGSDRHRAVGAKPA
jgi:hypothetical protein